MITNLYQHADGGFYCLLSNDAPGKHPETGEWVSGVIYTGEDQQMRWTHTLRWMDRFTPVAEYKGDDDQIKAMIRRCNPEEFDMADVWAGWHDTEMAMNSEVIQLSIAVVLAAAIWTDDQLPRRDIKWDGKRPISAALTIGPEHLQHVLQNYKVEREARQPGYRITIAK